MGVEYPNDIDLVTTGLPEGKSEYDVISFLQLMQVTFDETIVRRECTLVSSIELTRTDHGIEWLFHLSDGDIYLTTNKGVLSGVFDYRVHDAYPLLLNEANEGARTEVLGFISQEKTGSFPAVITSHGLRRHASTIIPSQDISYFRHTYLVVPWYIEKPYHISTTQLLCYIATARQIPPRELTPIILR